MSGSVRPFDSTKCEAKRVLISVDLPRPVWPAHVSFPHAFLQLRFDLGCRGMWTLRRIANALTNNHHIELETPLQKLVLNLACNGCRSAFGH